MYSDRPLCEKSERLEVIKIDHIKIDLRVAGPDPPLKIENWKLQYCGW